MSSKEYFLVPKKVKTICTDTYLRERSWRNGYIAEVPSQEEVNVFKRAKKYRRVPPMRGC